MKKVGFVIGLVVVLVGVVLFYPKSDNQKILVEDNQLNQNTSLAFYIEQEDGSYSKSNTLPSTGYTLNTSKSVCSNGAIPTWEDNRLYFNNLTKNGTSCYLYFDTLKGNNYILSHYDTILTRGDFSTTVTDTTTGTIYSEDTSKGRTYYFAGNPTDNWVKFANKYWRIIRINEDGSLRIIYQGTSANTTGTGTQSGTSAFNSTYTDNMYVGFKYTSGNVHGTGTNSIILTALNTWYSSNLSSYASSIDGNAGFCGDRTPSTSSSSINSSGGIGTTTTYYAGYIRLITNKQPTFDCPSGDLYTIKGSEDGNKALTYPIGLISADEVAYAGGVFATNNTSYYLYTGQNYWTMSPSDCPTADVFYVDSSGQIFSTRVSNSVGVRPVINLRADVTLSGSGTTSDPYVVKGAE